MKIPSKVSRKITLAIGALALLSIPAVASPLCKKLKSKLERDQCECSHSTGGRVEEQSGKVTFQVPANRQFAVWRTCLTERGHKL